MSPIILKTKSPSLRTKMAAFDYDWTLVHPMDGKTFPTNIHDWQWMYSHIPRVIKDYYEKGYMIVIFTNQSKDWKCEQIRIVLEKLEVPLYAVIARDKTEYKPNPILFDILVGEHCIDKTQSFFVGDALGRTSDFSDSDKVFANHIGISYQSPEHFFGSKPSEIILPEIKLSNQPEIIIMMGYPGSGKSTIAKMICEKNNYIHIQGDIYKTLKKMIKAAIEPMQQKRSIVFDATNSKDSKRKEYIDCANKLNYQVTCIHVTTSLEDSYKRNLLRQDKDSVPRIAYSVYKKHFVEPSEKEGFRLITI